jgi:hypothetical protein
MSGKRYAVLDANGVVVNHILIKDPLPAKYWPGYGAALVPLEDCDVSAGAALDVHVLKIKEIPQIGDTLDVNTGELTKFVPELLPYIDEKGDPVLDKEGNPAFVSAAPAQKFAQEVDPKTVKEVFDKPSVETKEEGK